MSNILPDNYFNVPHGLIQINRCSGTYRTIKLLGKAELRLYLVLLHYANRLTITEIDLTDEELKELIDLSRSSLYRARRNLSYFDLIEYRPGYLGVKTKYTIKTDV